MSRAIVLSLALVTSSAALGADAAAPGQQAPDFTLPDLDGKTVTLSSLRGKTVVLEWFNPGCPYVVYAHGPDGPLRELPGRRSSDTLVWLAVNSGAPGKQGHGVDVNRAAATEWKMGYPVLLDESGDVGRAYGAKTTPQMVVVDPQGRIAYNGALDNAPLGKPTGERTTSYLVDALDAMAAGQPVPVGQTRPYGCSVKY